ncbi:MAG: YihY family inner membrane protein [Gammaproteobacteria bacterium]|nr:YihY family inner membrane protein [Gammaproteobacteria bacterium]
MEEKLNWLKQFAVFTLDRFSKDRCPSIAAELTVTTLLSLVPFLTVVLSLFSLFPQFQSMELEVQQLLVQNLIPESGETIQEYLSQYVKNTQGLTAVGIVFLIVTSLMLMSTIDKSFNHIWQAKGNRSAVRVFLVYWAVLTMGPFLLGLSLAISSYFASLPLVSDVVSNQSGILNRIIPMAMSFIAFTVMFIAVPNRAVKVKHALVSALITALMFELAKYGFGLFVKKFSTYQLIFGALAAVPLFLIWMQLSWMILLIGAEICHALGAFEPTSTKRASQRFIVAARILKLLTQSQIKRSTVTVNDIQNQLSKVRSDTIAEVLSRLINAKLVVQVDIEGYSLTGDSTSYQLSDILKARITEIPEDESIDDLAKHDKELAERIRAGKKALIEKLSAPLVDESHQD